MEEDDSGAENIAYCVPSMVLEHFLRGYLEEQEDEGGEVAGGLPMLGLRWQRCESRAMREGLGLPGDRHIGEVGGQRQFIPPL